MLKFRPILAAGLIAAALPAAAAGILPAPASSLYDDHARQQTIASQRDRMRTQDPPDLREAIDETHTLFSALASESVQQDRAAVDEMLKGLRQDHQLPQAERRARHALELAEEIQAIQAGIRQQQRKMEAEPAPAPGEVDPDEARLLGLQSDLLGSVEKLRGILRSLHKEMKEGQIRDLRNWAMVSEGLLRRRREDRQEAEARQRAAEALPIDARAVAPAGLSPAAGSAPAPGRPPKSPATGPKPKPKPGRR